MAPAKKPLMFWRGNTETIRFRFLQDATIPLNLVGSRFVMTIKHDGPDIVKDSAISGHWDIPTPSSGEATVLVTVEDTRLMQGANVRYEIERLIAGTQKTLLWGPITIEGGGNGDV